MLSFDQIENHKGNWDWRKEEEKKLQVRHDRDSLSHSATQPLTLWHTKFSLPLTPVTWCKQKRNQTSTFPWFSPSVEKKGGFIFCTFKRRLSNPRYQNLMKAIKSISFFYSVFFLSFCGKCNTIDYPQKNICIFNFESLVLFAEKIPIPNNPIV